MQNAHSLIEHIANFTSQRDLDLLSFSLLKSVNSMLKPTHVKVLRVDSSLKPEQEIRFTKSECEVFQDGIEVGSKLHSVIEHMTDSDSHRQGTKLAEGDYLYVYLMTQTRRNATYLVMQLDRSVSHAEDFLMTGILEIFKNFSELLRYSQTDELTGLANRKTFEAAINKVFELLPIRYDVKPVTEKRAPVAQDEGYWLVLLDIDHFKKINDEYGHLYGDEVLVRLAQLLNAHFRNSDLLFRFGGEEFVVIMRCHDKETCEKALERLRTTVEGEEFPGGLTITISGGAVEIDKDTFHVTLLDYADKAMYRSKHNGRNQITFFEDMVARGEAEYERVPDGEIELF